MNYKATWTAYIESIIGRIPNTRSRSDEYKEIVGIKIHFEVIIHHVDLQRKVHLSNERGQMLHVK